MAILDPVNDKPKYFPNVAATGDELQGLIDVAQSFVESPHGCDRELEQHTEVILRPVYGLVSFLPYTSLTPTTVEVRGGARSDGFRITHDWTTLTTDDWELYGSRIQFLTMGWEEVKVEATVGYDFTAVGDRDVDTIKGVAGRIVQWFDNKVSEGLLTYRLNPGDPSLDEETFTYNTGHLKLLLQPLVRFRPLIL